MGTKRAVVRLLNSLAEGKSQYKEKIAQSGLLEAFQESIAMDLEEEAERAKLHEFEFGTLTQLSEEINTKTVGGQNRGGGGETRGGGEIWGGNSNPVGQAAQREG